MIRINLLPHREEKKKELKSKFYAFMMFGGVAGVAVILLVGLFFSSQLSEQSLRNSYLKKENLVLDEQIKEVATLKQEIESLKARQEAVEDLQGDRNQPVFMMNELVKLAPEGLYLTVIKQEGQRITLKGYAQSHAVVGIFVNQMTTSQWMTKPEILRSKAINLGQGRDAKRVIDFDLNVGIKRPRELEAEAASAAGSTPAQKTLSTKIKP